MTTPSSQRFPEPRPCLKMICCDCHPLWAKRIFFGLSVCFPAQRQVWKEALTCSYGAAPQTRTWSFLTALPFTIQVIFWGSYRYLIRIFWIRLTLFTGVFLRSSEADCRPYWISRPYHSSRKRQACPWIWACLVPG